MNAKRILAAMVLVLVAAAIGWNQWRLQRAVERLDAGLNPSDRDSASDKAAAALQQAEARHNEAKAQLQVAEQKLANANVQIAQLDQRLRQLETSRPQRIQITDFIRREPKLELPPPVAPVAPVTPVKRAWGPEQAAGEPDTAQAGDVPTAWASREPDAGEEWLKLDYEKGVDIAEVRVRETHNPGAISKVTAFLANGSEVTLWEGVEPKAAAPVEMSFEVSDRVNARSVKVYLDTKRVPGWNEIDAVELIGRDGSHQWAKQASASSTYAEQGVVNGTRRLVEFE